MCANVWRLDCKVSKIDGRRTRQLKEHQKCFGKDWQTLWANFWQNKQTDKQTNIHISETYRETHKSPFALKCKNNNNNHNNNTQ